MITDESAIVLLFHHHWLKVTPQKALALKDGTYLLAPIHLRSLGPKINLCRNYKSVNYTQIGIWNNTIHVFGSLSTVRTESARDGNELRLAFFMNQFQLILFRFWSKEYLALSQC